MKIVSVKGHNDWAIKDTWHKNDTIYFVRDVPIEALMQLFAKLPPADGAFEWAKLDALDPGLGVRYVFQFQRKNVQGWRWFLYQVRREKL